MLPGGYLIRHIYMNEDKEENISRWYRIYAISSNDKIGHKTRVSAEPGSMFHVELIFNLRASEANSFFFLNVGNRNF